MHFSTFIKNSVSGSRSWWPKSPALAHPQQDRPPSSRLCTGQQHVPEVHQRLVWRLPGGGQWMSCRSRLQREGGGRRVDSGRLSSKGLLWCVWRWSGGLPWWRCSAWPSRALLLLLLSGFGGRHWCRGRQLLASGGHVWAGGELVHHSSTVFHGWRQSSGPAGDKSSGEPTDRAPQHVRVRRSQPSSATCQGQHPWAIHFKIWSSAPAESPFWMLRSRSGRCSCRVSGADQERPLGAAYSGQRWSAAAVSQRLAPPQPAAWWRSQTG